MRNPLILTLALALSFVAFSGCKSPAEKACANLAEHGEKFDSDEDVDIDECVEEIEEIDEECSNGDEVLDCIADIDADDEGEFFGQLIVCQAKCDEK